ncbi:MAG TPA: tRNA pseudouridine(55) synthase TruB [Myxococcota bacterium]|nr:tRNA pseudouridine(55) synthase TruB [Myxococcota bacterium]
MARGRRRREAPGPSGFLVVDKPAGITSHDAVDAARRAFGTRRVGHLGTLDPLATGVLPLAVRDATKLVPYVGSDPKVYAGAIALGVATDTYDAEGRVLARSEAPLPAPEAVRAALAAFVGEIAQVPPMFSSVKHEGEPLHRIARRGGHVERAPRKVTVHAIEMRAYRAPLVEVEVVCSAGTYVRSLAEDLGRALGCGAHLANLRRTRSGPFLEAQAVTLEALAAAGAEGRAAALLLPPADVLGLPRLALDAVQLRRVSHGGDVSAPPAPGPPALPGSRVAAVDEAGTLIALLEVRADRRLYPLRVLHSVAPQG